MYHQFNIQQFYVLFTLCIFVFCVDLGTNSYYSLYNINLSVFITEMKSVYSAVRTVSINQTDTVSSLKGQTSKAQRLFASPKPLALSFLVDRRINSMHVCLVRLFFCMEPLCSHWMDFREI